MRTVLTSLVPLFLLWSLVSSQEGPCIGDSNIPLQIEQLIENPPSLWSVSCLNEQLIDEFLKTRSHVEGVLECMQSVQLCRKRGYGIIADEIFNRVTVSGDCPNCSSRRLRNLVRQTTAKLQNKYPNLYRKGLAYLV